MADSFYGGKIGQPFKIVKIFNNKKELDANLTDVSIFVGQFVLISYGEKGTEGYQNNLAIDNNKSYNNYLYQKSFKNNSYVWEFISDLTADSGPKGDTGDTYVPSVSADGYLTWTLEHSPSSLPDRFYIKGEKGDVGETGSTGPQGDKGDTGEPGKSATIAVGAVETGDPGTEASVTNTGTESAAVFHFVIPRGAKGEQGERGLRGERGERGETGAQGEPGKDGTSFRVLGLYASLSALQAAHPTGSSGDAWAVGTSESNNIYLWNAEKTQWENIGSIKGLQGEKGDPGETGPIGPQGETGATGKTGNTYVPTVNETGDLSWTIETNPTQVPSSVNIRGPKGETGAGLNIKPGVLDSSSNLPQSAEDGDGYFVKTDVSTKYNLYIYYNGAWKQIGEFSSVVINDLAATAETVYSSSKTVELLNNKVDSSKFKWGTF